LAQELKALYKEGCLRSERVAAGAQGCREEKELIAMVLRARRAASLEIGLSVAPAGQLQRPLLMLH